MGDHFGIRLFCEFDPRGAARGKHGHRFARFDAVDKFARLFHNGKVGGHVHIEHRMGIESADRRDHFSLYVRAHGQIERFAQRRAHGRRGKEYDFFRRVGKGVPYVVDIAALGKGAYGAGDDALSAAHAGGFGKGQIERASDMHVESSADGADCIHRLFLARRHAAHAVDALVVIAHHVGGGNVDGENKIFSFKAVFVYAVSQRKFLQFAVVVAFAGKALLFVLA